MRNLIYFLCFVAIVVQIPTAADVFLKTYSLEFFGPAWRYPLALLYAVVFELSLFAFVQQRQHAYAAIFAFSSLVINLISHNVFPWLTTLAPVFISLQLPLAIAIYSHELERLRKKKELEASLPKTPYRYPTPPAPPKPMKNTAKEVAPENTQTPAYAYTNGNGTAQVKVVPDKNLTARLASLTAVVEGTPEANKTCENCNKDFYAKNATARFCNPKCKAAAHRNKNSSYGEESRESE